jgi:serine beta-lactamase-like protein LACTB, mitochondrial
MRHVRDPVGMLLGFAFAFAFALGALGAQVAPLPDAVPAAAPLPDAVPAAAPLPKAAAAAADAFRQAHDIPGLSVAVGRDGEVAFAQGFGLADVENQVPATPATMYQLASISKPVTAVAVLQLVEQGKLTLDADVRTWVPEFAAKPWPVTLRQLLGHLGGIRHYRRGEGESTVPYACQRDALPRFATDPLLHEPDTKYHYSTYGFNLAAAAVEAASGADFASRVAQAIATPAGAASLQDDSVARLIPHRAQGYVRRDGTLRNSGLMDSSYKLGGGGLCSNAPDLVRFGLALAGGRLLTPASLQAMTTVQRTSTGDATGYGMGLRIGSRGGRTEWSHGGAQARVSTALLLVPDAGLVVAVLCNLEGVRPMQLAQQLADQLAPMDAGKGR